ncbi:transposase InsO family protein [Nocardiopsis aegyptia]|uniref:Transposase InsO family protein n=1 Tax=Nocardiopsis aegyptia TaxID=220378 RepID=A0A7Z0EKA2_9ACTN|nr:IS3 family transposase [Nocardiopsis aegyptia]NYJ33551.1 transposase InsO family protein [Nocardiopsis aegyptia]
MSRKGNCLDNAVIESFFGHVKQEFFAHTAFDSVEEFTAGLEAYIAWFNNERVHTYLEGLSPVQYRAQALAASPSISRSNYRGPVHTRRAPSSFPCLRRFGLR